MKQIFIVLLLLVITGCATEHDQRFGTNNPGAYHYQMGLGYLGERNYTGALIELTAAEKYEPDNPELLYKLGLAYIGKKRPDLAEPRFLRALILKPNYTAVRNDLGVAYLDLKRWDSAIKQFKMVKDDLFYDNSENASINLGLAYLGNGEYSKALEELGSAAALNPRNPIIHVSLGRVWFAMDKTEQAIGEYKKALDIYKDYGDAHYYLGLAYLKLNNVAAARASFKEAVRVIPETERGLSASGYLELLK
ncbi:MAG: tetratricopeptide repeat protein [Geobacteraceae bacterium]|nr:tetratricopeptide repeat protein [Geobacteraceae bacterium]